MTPPFTSMDWTNSYESPEAELELPMNEWNETQIHFSHDWGEMESAYSELNLGTAQAEVCSPSELFWPLGNLQGDSTFDNFSFQTALPESCYLTPALQASWYYPNPVPSTPSGNSDQNNSYYEPNGIPDTSSAIAQTPPKANYICETCGRICLKQHLLNDHKKIHDKSHACPVQRCPHRTAKSRDMERHVRAQHPDSVKAHALPTPPRPVCPVRGCKHGRSGFARKDHLRRHLQKAHPDWLPQT